MRKSSVMVAACATLLWAGTVMAGSEEISLNNCQNAVKAATATFIKNKVAAIGTCLQAVSTQMVKNNAADASGAASTCVTQLRKLNDPTHPGKSLGDKLAAAITKKCDPAQLGVAHTLGDVLGSGATASQPLNADDLAAWCAHFGGSGSITSVQDWTNCISAAAECDVDSAIAAQYPRVLDWLVLVKPSMQVLTAPGTDPNKISDAVAGLDAVKAKIDGPDNDNIVSVQCGGIASTGTAATGDVLTGKTFSNSAAGGLTGTMPNNGAANFTPGAAAVPVPAGYYSGGQVNTDANLVSDNIKSGATIFGVSGNSNVVNTGSGDAVAGELLSGKVAWVDGAQVIGTMPDNGAVTLTPSTTDQTIAAGYHNGAGKCAGDADLVSGNIKSGVNLFGVVGSLASATCGNGTIDAGEQCDQNNLYGATCVSQGFAFGTLRCGAGCVFDTSGCSATRYVDNADGTITDKQTNVVWEKKVKMDGTPDLANLQDADNSYPWANLCSVNTGKFCQPSAAAAAACAAGVQGDPTGCAQCADGDGTCTYYSGTTAWEWVVALNTANFGGHADWRLPTLGELLGLVEFADVNPPVINVAFAGASCGAGCADIASPACACTQSSYYWSATTSQTNPEGKWFVYFYDGSVFNSYASGLNYVRAVRSGL